MSPPPAGSAGRRTRRTALQRLGAALRRRLRPDRGAPPATVPGLGSGEETAIAAAAKAEPADQASEPAAPEPEPEPEPAAAAGDPPTAQAAAGGEPDAAADAGARIDAARERLRARIEPPEPDAD